MSSYMNEGFPNVRAGHISVDAYFEIRLRGEEGREREGVRCPRHEEIMKNRGLA
jgi:hypothetical protein